MPFLSKSVAYDPANPTSTTSPTRVDPDVKNDRTREFIVGFDRQVGSQMAFGASYIWRKYDRFLWNDRDNLDERELPRVAFTPTGCPAGARCETVTYFEPTTPAAVDEPLHEHPGPLARFQRLRSDVRQAHGEPLVR